MMSLEEIENLLILVDRPTRLREALPLITEYWVDQGNAPEQTVLDLRDACIALLNYLDSIQANP